MKVLLIDGHGMAYRAFFATSHTQNIMATSKGEWTNAVYVFATKLLKAWREQAPDYIVVAFDRGTTFRHQAYSEYKAQRARMPEELRTQLGRIEQMIKAFNIPMVTCEGYEADDVLGTLSSQATARGMETIILTGDTDILQLVDDHVHALIPRGRYSEEVLYDSEQVRERYEGLTPAQLIDLKALIGDSSDNIPGLKGIGEKTALALLNQYGTVEGIYDHLDEIAAKRPREALEGRREEVMLYKDLVTIRCNAPCSFDLEQARAGYFDRAAVIEVFNELEFHSLMDRIPEAEDKGETADVEADAGEKNQYQVVDTPLKLDRLVAQLSKAEAFAFDTETTSVDPMLAELVGISISVQLGQAWYIPVGHGRAAPAAVVDETLADLPLFAGQPPTAEPVEPPPGEVQEDIQQLPLALVVERLKPIFENPQIAKYGHNASYDIIVLRQQAGIEVQGLAFDTMVAAWVLDPGRQLGLKALAFNLLGIEMTEITDLMGRGKSQKIFSQVSIADAAPYACADADMTLRLVELLSKQIRELDQWALFADIEMPMVSVLCEMEQAGVQVDPSFLAHMSGELEQEQQRIEQEIYALVGHKFNIQSTKQLGEVLFDELRLPRQGIRKTTHGYSTAADVLDLLKGKHPVVALILEHRQISKLRSTYVDALPTLINPRTRRIHTSYNQTGAVTGRLSSSSPNLQNIPIRTELGRQIRKGFIPREGWVFVAADYSQIELRILAHVSQDPELLDAFRRGQDVHARTAAAVFGIPIEQVTKDQRQLAKTVNFGLIYGQSAFGLAQQSGLDFDEAERFIDTYFSRYPGVRNWLDRTRGLAYEHGYVETLLGRRRYFPELKSTQRAYAGAQAAAIRQAINAPIQGTAADILKIAMIRLARALVERDLRARMVLQVHDEVVLEVPRDEVDEVVTLTCEVMENAYELSVPLKVDVEVGENWFDMHAV